MIHKTRMSKILLWGDGAMTMNAKGESVHTLKTTIVYYLWKIPIWRTINYIDDTEEELQKIKAIILTL